MEDLLKRNVGGVEVAIRRATPDLRVARSCLVEGEFDSLKGILPSLKHNFIIDAGGYIGTAAIALSRLYPDATVVSVEASSSNFAVLSRNVSAFPRIVPLNMALVGTKRVLRLKNRGTGEWGYTTIEAPRDNPDATTMEMVEGITVSEIISMHEKTGVDIVKIDIEGGEIDVLDNSEGWMASASVVLVELHERIIRGCKKSFSNATHGRREVRIGKEKIASISPTISEN